MTPTTTIETLQKDVDLIATDLADLKKLTDEKLKETKAEAAADKVKTVKETINKKIEALKGLTDATSKADIIKLETMLTTLEASNKELETLKTAIMTPKIDIDIPDTKVETMDNSADLATIKTNITEITTLATTLQSEIDAYKLAKAKMTAAEITAKDKDIVDKKAAIETKRKETQALIDKIKAARKALKIKDMEEGVPKTALEKLQTADLAVLTADQTALDKILTPGRTLFEKVGDWVGKVRGKVKNWAEKTREWAKENPKTAIAATAGIGFLVRWISRLFRKKKKSETGDEWGKKEKKKMSRRKKALLRWWGILGWIVLFKNRDRISNRFKGLFGKKEEDAGGGATASETISSTEEAAESFEVLMKEKPEYANKMNTFWNNVNDFYDSIYKFDDWTMPEWLTEYTLGTGKEKYVWAIPHVLNNSCKDLNDLNSKESLFKLCAYGKIAEVQKWFADLIAGWAWKVVGGVMWMFGLSWLVSEEKVKGAVSGFLWTNDIPEINKVFRKMLKVMSYLNYAENLVVAQQIEKAIAWWDKLYKKSGDTYEEIEYPADKEDAKDLINDIQNSPSDYKLGEKECSGIISDIRGKKIYDFVEYNITSEKIREYNPDIKESMKDINKERDEIRKKLDKDPVGTLEKMKWEAEDKIANGMFESIRDFMPALHLAENIGIGQDASIERMIKESAWFKDNLAKYKEKFDQLKTEKDLNKVKKEIDNYYATLKELRTTQNAMIETSDENGNFMLTLWNSAKDFFVWSGQNITYGISLIRTGNVWKIIEWTGYAVTWAGPFVMGLGMFLKSKNIICAWAKMTVAPVYYPIKWWAKLFGKNIEAEFTNLLWWRFMSRFYRTTDSLIDWIGKWMSVKTAYTIFKSNAKVTTSVAENFAFKVLWATEDNAKSIWSLIESWRFDVVQKALSKDVSILTWGKRIKTTIGIEKTTLENLTAIQNILKQWGNAWTNMEKFGYELLAKSNVNNRSKVKDILSRADIMDDVKSLSSVDDVNLLAKNLWSSLDNVEVIDDIFAQNCKNVIASLDELKKSSGTWFNGVMNWLLEKIGISKKVLSTTEITDEAKIISEQMTKISGVAALDDAAKASLNIEVNATAYSHLLEGTDNVDDLTRKIIEECSFADHKDYFIDTQKIAEAKAYAQFLMDSRKVGTAIEYTKDLTPISSVLNMGDYNKLAKLINKGKSDDIVKFLTKRLDKEWVENAWELAQKFADQTKGMQNADKTEVAKIIGLSEKNTEKAIIAITKSLAQDKVFVTSILALNWDAKAITEALNKKCWLIWTNVTITEESEIVQKLVNCEKAQDVEKTLEYTSKGLKRRIGISGVTAALAIAGAVMSIVDTVHAFNMIETTNNEDLKDVYRQRGYVSAWFAALDTLVAVDATCELAYLAFSVGQWAFMSTGVGAVIIIAIQGVRYMYDQYSLWAEFQAKNAEDRRKEWLWLYFIWYYRSGGKTSWENVKDFFGSATDMPLEKIVEWLIDQTLWIQEWAGTPDQQRVKWYMKEYMTKKYDNKLDHMESAFSMMSEALEYATFAEYINNIKNWIVKQDQITWDMADFMSKYPVASNQDNLIAYFNKYKDFVNVQQTQNLEKYRGNLQKYSDQELTFIYEQLGRYNDYYILSVEWVSLLTAVRTLLKEKNIDTSKLQLNFEEPPINREQIEKFIATLGAEGNLQESIGDASEVKGKIDQVIISDEDLIEKYWAVPTLEIYTFLKIARIFGYAGEADLDGIKIFLSEESKDKQGIYRDWNEWRINNTAFWSGFRNRFGRDRAIWTWDNAVKNLKDNIDKMDFDDKYLWAFDSAGIKTKLNQLREDIDKKIEVDKMQSIAPVSKNEIVEYLKNNNWKYTLLSIQLLSRLLQKNAVKNSGHYLFKYENNKIIALPLDTHAKEKLFFVDEIDTSSESKFKYEIMTELDAKPMFNQLQDLRKIINLDDDEFDVKQNPAIEKIIADKEMEIQIFMSNLNNYDKPKQKELYYKKLEEIEAFHQSFLISFLSQSADNTFSNDVDEENADEKILQSTKYGEWQNFNSVIVNKYKKEYNVLQLSDEILAKLNGLEWWFDYVNYYYRGISLAMFKSYVLYQENGQFHAQGDQNLEINELEKNLWEIKSYKEYMKQFKWKETTDDIALNFSGKIQQIKTIE